MLHVSHFKNESFLQSLCSYMCEPGIMFNTSMNNINFSYDMEAASQLLIFRGVLSGP